MSWGAIIFWLGCAALGLGVIGGASTLGFMAYLDARRIKASMLDDADFELAENNVAGGGV